MLRKSALDIDYSHFKIGTPVLVGSYGDERAVHKVNPIRRVDSRSAL